MRHGTLAAISPTVLEPILGAPLSDGFSPPTDGGTPSIGRDVVEASIADLQRAMEAGTLTSYQITLQYMRLFGG